MNFAFPPEPVVGIPATVGNHFPARNIYCVGRNYAAHAREMGGDPTREAPVFFMKPAQSILTNYAIMPYPPATRDLHYEVELVVALHRGGRDIPVDQANTHIFGYAVGLDMTRRDLQKIAKDKGEPWDMGKSFDFCAPLSAITPVSVSGIIETGKIELTVNGDVHQSGDLNEMIWGVPEIIGALSRLVELHPGDLIFTGTPAGVGPVVKGDRIEAAIAGLETLIITVG